MTKFFVWLLVLLEAKVYGGVPDRLPHPCGGTLWNGRFQTRVLRYDARTRSSWWEDVGDFNTESTARQAVERKLDDVWPGWETNRFGQYVRGSSLIEPVVAMIDWLPDRFGDDLVGRQVYLLFMGDQTGLAKVVFFDSSTEIVTVETRLGQRFSLSVESGSILWWGF